jgi:signal transduction histidine kinase/FixJ family two-component response regulator
MDEEIIRVFLVDDDEDDYVLTRDLLAEAVGARFELDWVDTFQAALEAMGRAGHDVYLVDYRLGERDGVELLRVAIASGCRAPIIMLTGRGDHAVDVAAMKAGAADYLDKSELSAPLLERSIRHAIERRRAEWALGERVKELTCLYAVSHNMQKDLSVDELCRRAVEHLGPAMQFPEITVAVIELDGKPFTSEKYTEGLSHGLHAEIRVGGEARGQVGVYYAEDRPFIIPEEQNLVNGVAEALGLWLEHKEAEKALQEYAERLEERVEERTQELREAQEELVRQEKLAVLGQLGGGVAHELRNPLGVIKNAAYFLNMVLEEPDPEVKEMLDILEQEVRTSERIINSLLDFARPKPPVRRKVDVNEVVQAALSRTTMPANVEVVTRLDESLPTIQADPGQLAQVFGNIILNAVQAMPDGGQLLMKTWQVSEKPARSGQVVVSITDTGVGIPEENLEKLFQPLFTTKAKGIGLGLALVKMLVEGHGGSIEVESTVGEESTFTVKLPLAS